MGALRSSLESFRKDYVYLDGLIGAWYDRVAGGDGLCLAIDRKAVRLIEWWRRRKGLADDAGLVTEVAIPFIDWTGVESVTLIEEAIYHGSTFRSVYNVVKELCASVVGSPLVVSEEARRYASIRSVIDKRTVTIGPAATPFFIDTVTSRFLEIGKPSNIEYPLIYVPFCEALTTDRVTEIASTLDKRLRGASQLSHVYTSESYSRERRMAYSNVTYVMGVDRPLADEGAAADFTKFRFFIYGSRLCIAVMSPWTINAKDICRESPLFSGDMLRVWEMIYDAADSCDGRSEAYMQRRERSLVMMANYLLSLSAFLEVSGDFREIVSGFGGGDCSLDVRDLCYLCGPELASRLVEALSFDMSPSESRPTRLSSRAGVSSIPPAYKSAYTRQMGLDIVGVGTSVSDLVSGQYSSMHWHVELKSRADMGNDSARLNFGESYASMLDRYRQFSNDCQASGDECLLLGIHKNVDLRIDNGSVVPGYVVRSTPTMRCWRTMFRSGSNEDLVRDQFLRIMNFIHGLYCRESGTGYIPRIELELILALLIKGDGKSVSPLFSSHVSCSLPQVGEEYACRRDVPSSMTGLVDAAIAYRLFAVDEKEAVTLRSAVAGRYVDGTPLTDEEDTEVSKVVKAVAQYGAVHGHDKAYFRNILNSLAYDGGALSDRLSQLRSDLAALIKNGESPDVGEMTRRFENIFDHIPRAIDKADISKEESTVERRVAEAELQGAEDVRRRQTESASAKLFIVFNLWSRYCGLGYSPRLNARIMSVAYKFFGNGRFSDGSSVSEWFQTDGSAESICGCVREVVISHLTEAIAI